jgi:hypothetical protein
MRGAYWIAFLVCAAAATVPLLVTGTLPSADLPEHMAQVAIWKHLHDPCHRYEEIFELNPATPYLLGYVIMRVLATVMTVSVAAKVTVWLSIVLLPLSLRALLRRGGGDPWLSLLGFLLAYGYVFYWGFLNFALAIPIGIFYLALVHEERPRLPALTAMTLLLILAHALMFVFCAMVTVGVAMLRRSPRLLVPLVAPVVLFGAFVLRLRQAEQAAHGGITWGRGVHHRLMDMSSLLFANAWEPLGLVLVFGILLAVLVTRPRVTRDRARWVLIAVATAVYFLAPQGAFGSAFLYTRFTCFLAVGALLLCEAPRQAVTVSRALMVGLVVLWMAVLTIRFQRFDVEVREFDSLVEKLPPDRRIVLFNIEPFSENVPGPVYWHFGGLYQVRRGGLTAWSFANYYPQIVRYRKGAEPVVKSQSTPVTGIDWPGILQYDYILFRGADSRRWLFRNAPVAVRLTARTGPWWLFELPHARTSRSACPPLNE